MVFVVHKPSGVLSTARDTHGRRTVIDLVPGRGARLYPVGRLDQDSTGIILVTNDGDLAQRLTHPSFEVPRVYRATVFPSPVPERALRMLREGVDLDDGRTAPAKVRQLKPGVLELTIHEGRNHQVKRMCEAVGHRVRTLTRTRFGPLRLDDLPEGAHRRLKQAEVESLRRGVTR
jgi:23S rRNA pseudouridine2605 synthase